MKSLKNEAIIKLFISWGHGDGNVKRDSIHKEFIALSYPSVYPSPQSLAQWSDFCKCLTYRISLRQKKGGGTKFVLVTPFHSYNPETKVYHYPHFTDEVIEVQKGLQLAHLNAICFFRGCSEITFAPSTFSSGEHLMALPSTPKPHPF